MRCKSIFKTFKVDQVNNICKIININEKETSNYLCRKLCLIIDGEYLRIDTEKIFAKINEIFRDSFYRQNCDGLLISPEKRLVIVIELKTTLNRSKFKKALKQMIASFFKIISLLSLICSDFGSFEPIFIFAFKQRRELSEDEMKNAISLEEKPPLDSLYENIQQNLEESTPPLEVIIERIPIENLENFNPNLRKYKVKLIVLKCETYYLEEILNRC